MADEERIQVPPLAFEVVCQALLNAAPVLADYEAAGIPAADVIEQFLGEKCAFVIASTGAGIMPVVDKALAERVAAAQRQQEISDGPDPDRARRRRA
jgi:hypothetical protein